MIQKVNFSYTGAVQSFTAPMTGTYLLEAWGASGGNSSRYSSRKGGKGGYACGSINLTIDQTIYIHVGGYGGDPNTVDSVSDTGGYNGGGSLLGGQNAYGAPGGGATDFRTVPGAWNDTNGLNNRILVAGGGGGANTRDDGYGCGNGGDGGGLIGGSGTTEGQNSGGLAYGYGFGTGGTQTDGGTYRSYQNGVLIGTTIAAGTFGIGGVSQSGGGGGWYGGGYGGHGGAGGGSSFVGATLSGSTTPGLNLGHGKAMITYNTDMTIYYLIKDGSIYLPCDKYFNKSTGKFIPLDISTIKSELELGSTGAMNLTKPFDVSGTIYNPLDIIDFSQCKIGAMSLKTLTKLNFEYTPSDKALAKTNIKVKDKYLLTTAAISFGVYLDITTDKTKIDYFIDYGQAKTYKSSSILNKEMISDSFYANFKLNKPDSLLSSVTLYNKYYYKKLQESQMDVYNNFKDSAFVVFHDDYDLMLVNRIAKKELINYIETIDKF